jgi:DNA ligase (NAD+)
MDIEGLGREVVKLLSDGGIVKSLSDLYLLEYDQLLELKGFAEKKTENLLLAIQDSKTRLLPQFIFALGIRHVGEHVARLLAEAFSSIDGLRSATEEQLNEVYGVGPEVALAVAAYFSDEDYSTQLDALLAVGVNPKVKIIEQASTSLEGKSVVVTGKLTRMSRDEIHLLIKQHGGRPVSSVSKKTDLLIAGEKAGSKLVKAEGLGVSVMSEDDFLRLVVK